MQTNIGLLGCGNVGSGVAKMLLEDQDLINRKCGWPVNLAKVAVSNLKAKRLFQPPQSLLTTDPYEIVGNPDIQVVVELIGGIEPAKTLILKAINSGQHIITANKALLALHGQEIFEAAAARDVEVLFEGSVAGTIPIIRTLKEDLAANKIQKLFGILNGTTNYILTRMTREGLGFDETLQAAQEAGFAEADPTLDIEGWDAAHKLVILTALAHGIFPNIDNIHVEGIKKLKPLDFYLADELGYVIKLLGISSKTNNGLGNDLEVRLHPVMLPKAHLLADVSGAMNAVYLNGHACGDILLYGAGAGMMPTASSVMGDIIELSRSLRVGCSLRVPYLGWKTLTDAQPIPMSEVLTSYYLRFSVIDKPGVLTSISGIFANYGISIAQVIQKKAQQSDVGVPLVMLTHQAREKDIMDALKEIQKLDSLTAETMLVRVENIL